VSFPNFTFWSHLLGTLAVEVCCVAALGWVAQRLFRQPVWQRTIWQLTVVCLLLLPASEWTGFGRGMAWYLVGPKREANNARIASIGNGGPIAIRQFALPPPYRVSVPPKPAVWWPGCVWLVGAVVVLGRMTAAQILLLTLRLRRERITNDALRGRVLNVAKSIGLRRRICLLRMPESISPMAFGILRLSVGLPPEFEARFSATEQDAVLAHELAHLAAMDPMWFLAADFASALLWWHPLAWWVRRSLRVSSELAADEATALVADGPGALAKCLVVLGKEMTAGRGWGWVGINGGFRSKLGKRVDRLMHMPTGRSRTPASWTTRGAKSALTIVVGAEVVLLSGTIQTVEGESENGWRESWNNSPGALLLLAAQDQTDKRKDDIPATIQDAKRLYANGDLDEAETILKKVREDDPLSREARFYLARIREVRAKFQVTGFLDLVPLTTNGMEKMLNRKPDIATRIQDGKLFYELGKLDEAEAILVEVMKDDPSNRTAPYFLDLIKEARFVDRERAHKGTIVPIPLATNNIVYSNGRWEILSKLDQIHLNEVSFDLPLPEVLNQLRVESQKRDPDGVGVNFLINPHVDAAVGASSPTDNTGNVPPGAVPVARPAPAVDMSTVHVKISPTLSDLRLADVLNAITMVADQPIKYTVEDYGVVFSPKPTEYATLYSKVFRVDPSTFVQNLRSAVGANVNRKPSVVQVRLEWEGGFRRADDGDRRADDGHDSFGGPSRSSTKTGLSFPPRTNDTEQLDTMVRAYFSGAGVSLADPGKTIFFNNRTGMLLVRATAKDLEIVEKAVEALNQLPPRVTVTAKCVELSQQDSAALGFDWFLQANTTNSTGIMSDPQFRLAMNSIEHWTGKDFLGTPNGTTLSGRQIHLSSLTSGDGEIVDVMPIVGPDGFSIGLAATASVKNGNQVWQSTASREIWDGDTLVIGQSITNQAFGTTKLGLVFITVRIIDAAGNAVHTDNEIPNKR
jgi:beta-lactamase regulating signal transducer with metallopeptidase domain